MPSDLPLQIENLTFRYQRRGEPAIRDINLSLQAGEILLIAGASGCGKTTLARCINGLVPRSYKGELQGKLLYFGQDLSQKPLARISQVIGTVLQDPERQILGTRVQAEIAFGLENLGRSRPEIYAAIDEALGTLGIAHLRDRETFNLSGGEKQKVALAGVLAMRPSILCWTNPWPAWTRPAPRKPWVSCAAWRTTAWRSCWSSTAWKTCWASGPTGCCSCRPARCATWASWTACSRRSIITRSSCRRAMVMAMARRDPPAQVVDF